MKDSQNGETSFPPNPEESANFFNKLVFWWIQGIMLKGAKVPLQEQDVFTCHKKFRSKDLTEKAKFYWDKELQKSSPSLARALIRANLRLLVIIVLQCLTVPVFLLTPTVLVSKISSYFDPGSDITRNEAIVYGCTLCVVNVLYVAFRNVMFWNIHLLGPTFRVQTSALVYNKVRGLFKFLLWATIIPT